MFISILYRTKETLVTGNYMSVINVLMQLRKVSIHKYMYMYITTTTFKYMTVHIWVYMYRGTRPLIKESKDTTFLVQY